MCGIAGIYNFNHTTPDLSLLRKMGDTIAHRGPDHAGYYTNEYGIGFCHRRLSIIDLSERGNQPMSNDDESIWIVYNGEIYNYIELRDELIKKGYKFKSQTDTEVVIKAYQEYGIDCLKRFNGMFAFSLWDKKNMRFFAARDRVGIKPYYYYSNSKMFVFASEIKSLIKHPEISKEPNDIAISNYLLFDYQIDNQTWFKNIYSLEPGTYLLIENSNLKFCKYWNIEYNIDYTRSFNSFKDELRETIVSSIKSHWQSDVPVGAHLSGGVDSSTIVSVASKFLTSKFNTFSSVVKDFKEYDESKEINIVSQKFNTNHYQTSVDSKDIISILPKIIWHLDEPIVGPAVIPMYNISQLVKRTGIKVINGGQGVDEMFGGYKPYFTLAAKNILTNLGKSKEIPFGEILSVPNYLKMGGSFNRLINRYSKMEKPISWRNINENNNTENLMEGFKLMQKNVTHLDPFEAHAYKDIKYYLPGLLHVDDRINMAFGLEGRVPFVDKKILELSLKIPSWYKINKGSSKAIFREAVRGIVPDEILDNKIKRGYPTPISIWFSDSMNMELNNFFFKEPLLTEHLFNKDGIRTLLHNQKNNPDIRLSTPIWKALVTEIWFRNNFSNLYINE